MRSSFGDAVEAPSAASAAAAPSPVTAAKEIPYDHVATFTLLGQRGNRVQDVINVSIDGAFVAVAIGYSFIPAVVTVPDPEAPILGTSGLAPLDLVGNWLLAIFEEQPTMPATVARSLLSRLCGIEFKYSVVDSGSGRELQNKPIHNLAGLGESSGDRPFRPFAKPMWFMPRSTIRIEVEELSEGSIYAGAQLYIVLHGTAMIDVEGVQHRVGPREAIAVPARSWRKLSNAGAGPLTFLCIAAPPAEDDAEIAPGEDPGEVRRLWGLRA